MQLSTFPKYDTLIEVAPPQACQQALYPPQVEANHDFVRKTECSPMSKFSIQKNMMTLTLWTKRSLGHFHQSFFFGSLEIKSWLHLLRNDSAGRPPTDYSKARFEYHTSVTFRPVEWLVNLGAKYGFHACIINYSAQGWQHNLKIFCPVPDDAPIFQMCSIGNLTAVRDLLSGGYASVRDTDSSGRTPLLVSVPESLWFPSHHPVFGVSELTNHCPFSMPPAIDTRVFAIYL